MLPAAACALLAYSACALGLLQASLNSTVGASGDHQVSTVRGCVSLLVDSDLTPTHERRHRRCARCACAMGRQHRLRRETTTRPKRARRDDSEQVRSDRSSQFTWPVRQIAVPSIFSEADQAFVKFHGRGDDRAALSQSTLQELCDTGCHWAVAYPLGKPPKIVKEGAVMFLARLTENPIDIRIFGHAIAMKRVLGRTAHPSELGGWRWRNRCA